MPETSTAADEPPTVRDCAEIVPTAVGARFVTAAVTVTEIVCVAVKLPSLAVTVMVALPAATGVIVTWAVDTLTVATLMLLELAV